MEGQIPGVFCADLWAWGSCSWKDSGRTKPAGLVGSCLDSVGPGGVLGGALHRFGNSRVIDKTVTVT